MNQVACLETNPDLASRVENEVDQTGEKGLPRERDCSVVMLYVFVEAVADGERE